MRRAWTGVLLALLALPSCSGDDGGGTADGEVVPPAEWAATVCAAVGRAAGDLRDALAVIDDMPATVEADAPLGDQAGPLRDAFSSMPAYVDRYRNVVEDTPAPDTADGEAFREEVLADLDSAAETFGEAAAAAQAISGDTTVEDFFGGAQAFAGFPEAFSGSDLDFGEDTPPDIAAALLDDRTCVDVQNQLLTLIG